MSLETDSAGGKVAWRVEGGRVLVSFPRGHEVFPEGKEVVFTTLTPTDMVEFQGVKHFPNQDGITAENVGQLAQAPETLRELVDTFESAARVLDDAERLREKCMALVNQMAPKYSGAIRLEDVCLGMERTMGVIGLPTGDSLRSKVFAFGGLEFSDMRGSRRSYSMALDEQGRFNYSPDGILYKKTG